MIQVSGLTKRYGERTAIDSLDFKIDSGEVVGFLGPNGAGKSTTMKIITGLMSSTSGLVKIDGDDIFDVPLKIKKKIGYLPEIPPVYEDMKVDDYLEYVAQLKKVDKNDIGKNIEEAIAATSLHEVRTRLIGNLSKGFKQRVGIAQALVSKPEILVLDEPTVGLDPKQVSQIRELIQSLKGKYTIILSTHILSEVQAMCDRVIIINEGKIVAEDTIKNLERLISDKTKLVVKVLKNHEKVESYLKELQGVHSCVQQGEKFVLEIDSDDAIVASISEGIVSLGAGLIGLKISSDVGLEEVFLQLTKTQGE